MDKEKNTNSKKKKKWLIYVVAAIALVIIILLLLHCCGNSKRRKIVLHYGEEVIEVDTNFKLSDLDVEGGKLSFLVDSDGYIVEPNAKLDSKKEYSAHIIPDGKECVKVTYKIDKDKYTVDYQKGSGLLLPKDPDKKGYIFTGWIFEGKEGTPYYMMPVNEDMTIVAVFGKSDKKDGKCTLNCDTNKDGSCDYNCDTNNDGKPDTNIDTDGDGKADLNIDPDHDGKCNINCDANGDGTPDTNIDTDGDGICDQNCDENGVLGEKNYNNNYRYTCHGKDSAYAVISAKRKFISFVLDGKSIPESDFNEELIDGSRAYWFDYLIGSGKKVNYEFKTIAVDDKNQQYYFTKKGTVSFEGDCDTKEEPTTEPTTEEIKFTLTYNANGGKVSPSTKTLKDGESYGNLPTPTRSDYSFDGWYTKASGGNKVSSSTTIKSDTTIYAHWKKNETPKQDTPTPTAPVEDKDNGTISLSASKSCLVGSESTTITATLSNAKDSTINWSADSCITISGSGTSVTVTGNGCGGTATVTAKLNNGNSDKLPLNYENNLSYTVKDFYTGDPATEEGFGYNGNKLIITTNVPAKIQGSGLDGNQSSYRKTATFDYAGNVGQRDISISTACGQTASFRIYPQIN